MTKVVQSKTEPAGKLDIGSVETVIQLPAILSSYNKQYKHVDLSLFTGVTEQLQNDVLNHRLDGAFVTETDLHPDLVAHNVFQEELVVISDKTKQSFEQLKHEPLLCFSEGCGYRKRLQAWYQDQDITQPKEMEIRIMEKIIRSVIMRLSITIVPQSAVSQLEEKGLIQCQYLPEAYSKINTVFIRRRDAYLTSTLEKFIATIEETKDEPAYPLEF